MSYLIAGVAGIVGALFLWDGWKARALHAEWTRGVIVEGEVVKLIERAIPGPRVIAHLPVTPVVRYKTPEGEQRELVSSLGEYPSPYALGDKVAVRYLASDQPRAELDTALTHPSRHGSLLMGALCVAIALLIAFWDVVIRFLPGHP